MWVWNQLTIPVERRDFLCLCLLQPLKTCLTQKQRRRLVKARVSKRSNLECKSISISVQITCLHLHLAELLANRVGPFHSPKLLWDSPKLLWDNPKLLWHRLLQNKNLRHNLHLSLQQNLQQNLHLSLQQNLRLKKNNVKYKSPPQVGGVLIDNLGCERQDFLC